MKILKYLLFLILILLIGGAIFIGTKDGNFDVAGTKVINAPTDVIFNQIKDYKSWEQWGPWMKEDPNIEINYAEKTEGEGASYSWKSELMGNGTMRTIKVIPGSEIDQKIVFETPAGDSESDVYWRLETAEDESGTKVTWGMKGEQSFMEKVFMTFQSEDFESQLKQMHDTGLANLDTLVQEQMKKYTINVDGINTHEGGYYMYTSTASKMADIAPRMASMFELVHSYVTDNKIPVSGDPFTIYNEVNAADGNLIFSAGLPVPSQIITPEGAPVICGFMAPVTALKTTLKGNYTNLPEAYETAMAYLVENNIQADITAKMFEIYTNDPGEVLDPSQWITEVYIPIIVPENTDL